MFPKIKNFLFVNSSIRQTLIKNTFWLFGGELGSRILKMVLVLYAARILGVANWGTLAYAISIVSLFFIFASISLERVIIKEIAQNSERKFEYLSTSFFLRITLLACLTLLLLAIVPYFSNINDITILLLVTALFLGFDSLRLFILSIHRAFEQMEKEAYVRLATNFITIAFGMVTLFFFPSIKNLAYAYLIGSSAGLLIAFLTVRKYIPALLKNFSVDLVKPIWQTTWPFFILGMGGSVMTYMDMVMLGWWKTPIELGLYAAAQRLIQFLLILPTYVATASLTLFLRKNANLKLILEKVLSFTFVFLLPIALGGVLLGKEIILISFGPSYAGATVVFQVFSIGLLAISPVFIISNYIFALNMQSRFVFYSVSSAVLNIILNAILIPMLGINGAALATVVASLAFTASVWRLSSKVSGFNIIPRIKSVMKATLIMGIVTLLGKYAEINVLLNVGVSALVFFTFLFAFKDTSLGELKSIFS